MKRERERWGVEREGGRKKRLSGDRGRRKTEMDRGVGRGMERERESGEGVEREGGRRKRLSGETEMEGGGGGRGMERDGRERERKGGGGCLVLGYLLSVSLTESLQKESHIHNYSRPG